MTEAVKLSNRLKQTWSKTNSENWDAIEDVLKSAKKMINNGCIDHELINTYLTISESFKNDFGSRS